MEVMDESLYESEFEVSDAGLRVAGTGLPRLRAAVEVGAESGRGWGWWPWGSGRSWRRGLRQREARSGGDPYSREQGPGIVGLLARLRMDLYGYGTGNTKDAYGTEADVRAMTERGRDWAGFKLRVLSQNLWGLPMVSDCMEARVHAFCKTLDGGWDVIGLQEVWHARERDALRRAALLAGLRYSRHFEKGCGAPIMGPGSGGTGLLLLSRFPIVESLFWRFSANGQPYQFLHCDYLGGKGVGLVRLHTPAGAVDVYLSHFIADYSDEEGAGSKDRYKAHRVAQAFEQAHFIRVTRRSPLVVLMADLNAGPGSLPYGLQRSVAGLEDAFAEAAPEQSGHSYGTSDNVFTGMRDIAQRLDYVMFKAFPAPLCLPQAVEPMWELGACWLHKGYIPGPDAVGLARPHKRRPSPSTATPPTASTSSRDGSPVAIRPQVQMREQHSGRIGGSGGLSRAGSWTAGGERASGSGNISEGTLLNQRRISVSDHYGVAAEFIARDPDADDDFENQRDFADRGGTSGLGGSPAVVGETRMAVALSDRSVGGTFPQGPLLSRALTEIDAGVEAARRRRTSHLNTAKALCIVWMGMVVGGIAVSSDSAVGYLTRATVFTWGGLLSGAISTLFLAYWFSAKEELQGLKEVYQTVTNYERHLPMEEAFPDTGFDTSQINNYMEQHFR